MLSIADIPLPAGHFTGCICAVIRHGKYRLTAELLEGQACPLRAPSASRRDRSIRESLRAKMRYCFWYGDRLLFTHTDDNASFEYADKREEFKG